jgi:hypothetical protein
VTAPAPRRDRIPPDPIVRCHECQFVLGRITRRNPPPIVERLPQVRLFFDFARGEVGLLCPQCGAFGRVFTFDKLRGIVDSAEVADAPC